MINKSTFIVFWDDFGLIVCLAAYSILKMEAAHFFRTPEKSLALHGVTSQKVALQN
jgi:hypothetical protein